MDNQTICSLLPQQTPLEAIDDSQGPFCMSYGFDLTPLRRSIEAVGIVNPPLLIQGREKHTIVAGYRRIRAIKELKATEAACRIVPEENGLHPLQYLLLNLHENLAVRKLNDVEKGMVLNRLAAWAPRDDIVDHYMPLLGLRPTESALLFLQEMEKAYHDEVKLFVAKGGLSWQAIKLLSRMDPLSRAALMNVIAHLKLTVNQQSQVIDYIIDLTYIEKKSVSQFVGDILIHIGGSDSDMNRPQRAKAVIEHLRERRNPSITRAEKGFKKAVSELNLPNGVRISAPPYFEGEHYRFEALFKDGVDLKTKLEPVCRNHGLSRLGSPWEKDLP